MASANLMPMMSAIFDLPEILDPSGPAGSRVNRIHARVAKDAMRQTLEKHHRERVPLHFRQDARHRYQHKARKRITKRRKRQRHGSTIDLVASGDLKRKVVSRYDQIRVGGSTGAGEIRGTMIIKFPSTISSSAGSGVTSAEMADEIARFTPDETRAAAEDFRDFYVQGINAAIRSRRVRRRIAARLAGLGI